MKNIKLTLTIGTFISVFATSCTKCGFCNAPFVDIDVDAAKVCKGGNAAEYKAAVANCEAQGGGWYWDEIKK